MRRLFLLVVCLTGGVLSAEVPQWTFCYRKTFAKNPLVDSDTAFERIDTMPFNHLVFSFNALRPMQEGAYFRFSIGVRGVKSKKWLTWHHVCDWGNGVQQSYADKVRPDGYSHVRLDMHDNTQADGFRIRVEAFGGASLADIKLLCVSIAQLKDFSSEVGSARYADRMSVYISGVPCWSQMVLDHPRSSAICSPTSLGMATSYMLNRTLDVRAFADAVHDKNLDIFGNWVFNTAHAFTVCPQCYCYVQRLHTFGELYKIIRRGIPVVVSVRGALKGAPKDYPSGHLLTVVGFDANKGVVVCHDPAALVTSEVEREYELEPFLAAWERSYRLAYVLSTDVS